jgi:hypothetical protein
MSKLSKRLRAKSLGADELLTRAEYAKAADTILEAAEFARWVIDMDPGNNAPLFERARKLLHRIEAAS